MREARHDSDGAGISVCIVCRNEADKLEPCLESVSWADEVIVVDLSSTDDSVAVAERHGARVVSRKPVPIVEMVRNEAASHASNDWILALDPDERVTHGLAHHLRFATYRDDIDAVVIPRMNLDFGYPPSHLRQRYEPQLRMYRRSRVKWPEIPNALPKVSEDRLHRIQSSDDLVLMHDRNRNIPEVLDRVVRYGPIEGQSMAEQGQVFSARSMTRSMARTIYLQFFVSRAWRDGVPGMLRAGIIVAFKFYVWASFWYASGAQRTEDDDRYLRRLGIPMEAVTHIIRALMKARKLAMRVRQRGRKASHQRRSQGVQI